MISDQSLTRQRQRDVAEALRSQNLKETEAGRHLLVLSTDTHIDSLEVLEEEIILEGDNFSGPVLWHVTLSFPNPKQGPIVSSESFPGTFQGRYDDGQPCIETLDVDTSSLSSSLGVGPSE